MLIHSLDTISGQGQARPEARNQEFSVSLPHGWPGRSCLSYLCCSTVAVLARELESGAVLVANPGAPPGDLNLKAYAQPCKIHLYIGFQNRISMSSVDQELKDHVWMK